MTKLPKLPEKLKPCPFCKGHASYKEAHHDESCECPDEGGEFISCDSCGASTKLWFAIKDDVKRILADDWNRRSK